MIWKNRANYVTKQSKVMMPFIERFDRSLREEGSILGYIPRATLDAVLPPPELKGGKDHAELVGQFDCGISRRIPGMVVMFLRKRICVSPTPPHETLKMSAPELMRNSSAQTLGTVQIGASELITLSVMTDDFG